MKVFKVSTCSVDRLVVLNIMDAHLGASLERAITLHRSRASVLLRRKLPLEKKRVIIGFVFQYSMLLLL